MATTLQSHTQQAATESYAFQSHGTAAVDIQTEGSHSLNTQHIQLHISQLLQTSLELEKILQLFFSETENHLAVNSLGYRNESWNTVLNYGQSAQHSCHYALHINGDNLGDLILTRNKRFTENDLSLVEAFISSLVCPIRNALLYKEAVIAALKDPLTQIGNRIALKTTLDREVSLANRHAQPFSLLVIDIDHFKLINDNYGHSAGDMVLKSIADTLTNCCRETDGCYRFGGEEFVVILNQTDLPGSQLIAERIREKISAVRCDIDEHEISFTASIGSATLNHQETATALFDRADKALYTAKDQGRNKVVQAK